MMLVNTWRIFWPSTASDDHVGVRLELEGDAARPGLLPEALDDLAEHAPEVIGLAVEPRLTRVVQQLG